MENEFEICEHLRFIIPRNIFIKILTFGLLRQKIVNYKIRDGYVYKYYHMKIMNNRTRDMIIHNKEVFEVDLDVGKL